MSLSSLIVQREIATIRQVEEALARQVLYGGDLVTNMLEVAKLDEGTLTLLLAESFGMTAATLGPLPNPSERARSLITGEMAASRAMVPQSVENGALVLAVAEPLPKEVEEELTFALGLGLVQRVAPMVRVREALSRVYGTPLERRLQRLLAARLGGAHPFSSNALAPPATERSSVPETRAPLRPSYAPAGATPPLGSVRTKTSTNIGFPRPLAPDLSSALGGPAGTVKPTAPASPVQRPPPGSPRPARRRRGPIVREQAVAALEEANSRDAILDLFFDYARQYFDYVALFVVQSDIAEGREAFGDGAPREKVQAIAVPLDLPSVLGAARDAGTAVRVTPENDGLDAVLLGDMERKTRGEVLVVPIIVRKRAVALLYGDSGDDGVDAEGTKEVVSFALLVGQAFQKLIVRKKMEGALTPGVPSRVAAGESAPRRTPEPPVSRESAEALGRAADRERAALPAEPFPRETGRAPVAQVPRVARDSAEAAAAVDLLLDQTPTPVNLRPTETASVSDSPFAFVETPDSPRVMMGHPSDRPPPPNAFVLRRPSGPPIPREDPDSERPLRLSASGPPPSETFAVAPHLPPSSRLTDDVVLPSVIVDVSEELVALVDRVVAVGSDEAAEAELLRQGQHAMPAIMSRFPGPTVVDRARAEDGTLRAAECGPVLRLIAGQRKAALPFVLPLVGDGEPQRRYWATFLITELAYPEAVESLVPRLFDPDTSVRRVARLAARALGEVAPEALIERLVRYYRDPALTEEGRIGMIETLGELRERLAVPLLIDALEEVDEHVAAAARRALMMITRQDLGRDARRWQAWWAQNAGRHRLEWLIDALMHEVPAVRRAAGDELKALTKEYFGYYDDLPRKEREQAQGRYREWWRLEGRLRFQRR